MCWWYGESYHYHFSKELWIQIQLELVGEWRPSENVKKILGNQAWKRTADKET